MKTIAKFFVKNIRFTMMLTGFVCLAGYLSLATLKSETFPNVNLGKVIIYTHYRGAAVEDIESKITKVLEEQIRSVSGIKRAHSISQPGLSTISTEVDIDNYDTEKVIADLQRAVDRASDLPRDLENPPKFVEIKTDEMPIIEVSVIGGKTAFERNKIAYSLSEEMRDNKKISSVRLSGYQEPQFRIQLLADKLKDYYLSIPEVMAAIQSTTLSVPAGAIEDQKQKFLIKIDGKLKSVSDIQNIVVRSTNSGGSILLKDVASVSLDNAKSVGDVFVDGEAATNLVIAKKSSEDIIKLSEDVKKTLASYKEKYPNFKFKVYSDEGVRVGNRLKVLYSNAVFGLVLVIIFLLIFLSGRAGVMTAVSLPLAVLATFTYMSASGMSLNTITIMALIISIGMLVDNAVVISENFTRLMAEGLKPYDAAVKSIVNLWAPVTATALTTIAAFLPMMVTKGIMGKFIMGIPIIVTVSLLFSLFESFFFLPARLVLTAKKGETKKEEQDWFAKFSFKYFKPILVKMIRHRFLTMLGFSVLLLASFVVMGVFNKFILFPANQVEIYIGRVELPEGSTLSRTNEVIKNLETKIQESLGKDLKYIVGESGSSMMDPSDPKGKTADSVGVLKIYLTETGKNKSSAGVLEKLRSVTDDRVLRLSFEAMAGGPPVGDPLTLRVRSSNDKELEDFSKEIFEHLKKVDGVVDIRVNEQIASPEIQLKVDTLKAQSLGLSLKDIGTSFQIGFSGIPVNDVNLNNRDVDYFIEFAPSDKSKRLDVESMMIPNRFGKLIPVSSFAEVVDSPPKAYIERYDFKRTKTITSDLIQDKITSIEINVLALKKANELLAKYPSVSIVFGGEAENTAESMESLKNAMFLAIMGIFVLLILVFNSYAKPFIVLTTIPLGLVGVSFAFFIQGLPISFLAMIGVVGLSGIIVNSGIVLISFIEERKALRPDEDLIDVLADSSVVRLKAVVITSLTTISGLIPTAYGVGGSDEFISPMAMSISWGLVSGTILTLLWVPCAYMILEDINKIFKR